MEQRSYESFKCSLDGDVFGSFAGESFGCGGSGFLALCGGDSGRAGGFEEGFNFFLIHFTDVFSHDLMERDTVVEVVEVRLSGFRHGILEWR
jgi:hypothetical protein